MKKSYFFFEVHLTIVKYIEIFKMFEYLIQYSSTRKTDKIYFAYNPKISNSNKSNFYNHKLQTFSFSVKYIKNIFKFSIKNYSMRDA